MPSIYSKLVTHEITTSTDFFSRDQWAIDIKLIRQQKLYTI